MPVSMQKFVNSRLTNEVSRQRNPEKHQFQSEIRFLINYNDLSSPPRPDRHPNHMQSPALSPLKQSHEPKAEEEQC